VKLPFAVEDKIAGWELQAFQNPDESFGDMLGGKQFFFVLSVDLIGVAKVKKTKKNGGFRVFGSPNDNGAGGGGGSGGGAGCGAGCGASGGVGG
jgi:hypothetical protein